MWGFEPETQGLKSGMLPLFHDDIWEIESDREGYDLVMGMLPCE